MQTWIAGAKVSLVTGALIAFAGACAAQDLYPGRALSMIVPFSAGSQPDLLGRALAEGLGKALGQPIAVVNKEGAGGIIGVGAVAQSRPDGYTIGFGPQGQFSIQPHIRKDLSYKLDSFEFLCQSNGGIFVVVVGPKSPHNTLAELIEAARKAPGKTNFGSPGHATGPPLIGESIARESGVTLTHVPFRSVGDMYAQTVNGTVDFIVTTPTVLASGLGMKPLALLADERLAKYPAVPLLSELGFKRSNLPGYIGVYAPKGIPAQASSALRKACTQAVEAPGFKAASERIATPVRYADGPAYAAGIAEDSRSMGELLTTLGVKTE